MSTVISAPSALQWQMRVIHSLILMPVRQVQSSGQRRYYLNKSPSIAVSFGIETAAARQAPSPPESFLSIAGESATESAISEATGKLSERFLALVVLLWSCSEGSRKDDPIRSG